MELYEKCWLCGSNQIIDLYKVNNFTVVRCKKCSLRFIREMVSDENLKEVYTLTPEQKTGIVQQVYLDSGNIENLKYAYKRVADKIKRYFIPPYGDNPRLLDLGCSTGVFFDFFPDWDVYGVELEETTGKVAKSKHENVFIGDMKDARFKNDFFDCITIQDALDHSNNPMEVVKHCHGLLKENGLIVIKVHNIDCLLAKITGKRFYAICPPGHLTYFNLRTLKLLLSNNGFEYLTHFYNMQKLRLSTAIMRMTGSASNLLVNTVSNTFLKNMPFYKNYHDIITVIGIKTPHEHVI
jgi:2-polyprenyl-3-methyl-5-hydroxy-6-metoxy-1,4-benzoquinol methylase